MATYSGILAWRIPIDRGAWQATVHEVTKSKKKSVVIFIHIILYYYTFFCVHVQFFLLCAQERNWFIRYVNIQFYKTMPAPSPPAVFQTASSSTLCSFSFLESVNCGIDLYPRGCQ